MALIVRSSLKAENRFELMTESVMLMKINRINLIVKYKDIFVWLDYEGLPAFRSDSHL